MLTSLLVAVSLTALCPDPTVTLQKGMPEEIKQLADQYDFTQHFPEGQAICKANGFECLLSIYVQTNGDVTAQCGMKKPETI